MDASIRSVLNWALGIVAIGVGVASYGLYGFIQEKIPLMEQERNQLDGEALKLKNELKKIKEFSDNIEKIKLELKELNLQLESALEHMPRSFNLAGLLRKLSQLSQASGLEISTFKPKKNEVQATGLFYKTIYIDFDIKGTFIQFLVFLDQVSRLKRIINLESINLKAIAKKESSIGGLKADAKATIKTFRFVD